MAGVAGKLKTSLNRTHGMACSLDGYAAFRSDFQKLSIIGRNNRADVIMNARPNIAHSRVDRYSSRFGIKANSRDNGLPSAEASRQNNFPTAQKAKMSSRSDSFRHFRETTLPVGNLRHYAKRDGLI